MADLKVLSRHTKRGAALPREGGPRSRARLLNLGAPIVGLDADGNPEHRKFDWALGMDETREKLGNDRLLMAGRHASTSDDS